MTYDSTSPPVRVFDIVTRERDGEPALEPSPGGSGRSHPIAVHPLALRGWPPHVLPVEGSRPAPRGRGVLRRRERER